MSSRELSPTDDGGDGLTPATETCFTCFTCSGEGRIHDLDALPGMFWAADMTMQCPICEGSGVEPLADAEQREGAQ